MKYSEIKDISEKDFNEKLEAYGKDQGVKAVDGYRARTEKDGVVSKTAYDDLKKANETITAELAAKATEFKKVESEPHIKKAFTDLKGNDKAYDDFMTSYGEALIGLEAKEVAAKVKQIATDKPYMFNAETNSPPQAQPKGSGETTETKNKGTDLINQFQ